MPDVKPNRPNQKVPQKNDKISRSTDPRQKNSRPDRGQNKNQKEDIHLPDIKEKQSPRKEYGLNEIPASYTVHREKPTPREHANEDLSTVTKMGIVEKNRNLIYRETQLTKMKVEKLKNIGTLDNDVYLKLKKSKEEKRWDILMRHLSEHPKYVQSLWEFIRVEYTRVHDVLQDEYVTNIRRHFQPRLSNLKSTPGNLLKMSDILLEVTEEYDVKVRDLDKAVAEKQRELDTADKTLRKIKTSLLTWASRDEDPETEVNTTNKMAEDVLDLLKDVTVQKDAELQQKQDLYIELEIKVNKLTKSVKEKDKKINLLMDDLEKAESRANAPIEETENANETNEIEDNDTNE